MDRHRQTQTDRDRPTDSQSVSQSVSQSTDRPTDWLTDWLISWNVYPQITNRVTLAYNKTSVCFSDCLSVCVCVCVCVSAHTRMCAITCVHQEASMHIHGPGHSYISVQVWTGTRRRYAAKGSRFLELKNSWNCSIYQWILPVPRRVIPVCGGMWWRVVSR